MDLQMRSLVGFRRALKFVNQPLFLTLDLILVEIKDIRLKCCVGHIFQDAL